MKFTSREDIEAPIEAVYARLTDFDQFERLALRRGASVRRIGQGVVGEGTAWDVAFTFRGKERRMKAELQEMEEPNFLRFHSVSSGISGDTFIELVPLSPKRTRLSVAIELAAKSLTSRLLLQSMKLARGSLEQRLNKRVKTFGDDIAEKYRTGN